MRLAVSALLLVGCTSASKPAPTPTPVVQVVDAWSLTPSPAPTATPSAVPTVLPTRTPALVARNSRVQVRGDSATATGPVPAAVRQAFAPFGVGDQAVIVAKCESGNYAPDVVFGPRTGSAGERGVMQIHPVHRRRVARMGFTWDQMFEVGPNLAVARAIFDESKWAPWSCRPGSAGYRKAAA